MKRESFLVGLFVLSTSSLVGKKMVDVHMDELYKKIGDELVNMRKEYPACQTKVYVILDQVDKMYNMAKTSTQKADQFRETIKNKELENSNLNNEVIALRSELDSMHGRLEATHKSLELEKQQAIKLAQEKNELASKEKKLKEREKKNEKVDLLKESAVSNKELAELSALDQPVSAKAQNLNLISTSEPNSPR